MSGEAAGSTVVLSRLAGVVEQVLWPAAQEVDQAGLLPPSHIEALADLGLLGQAVPPELGGLGLAPADQRRVLRLIGSGCGATGFAFAQHHGVVGALARTANTSLRDRWLGPLCRHQLAGIAFAHLRRPGPPPVAARRVAGGWRIDGEAPWATSWGLAEVFLVAAGTTTADGTTADGTTADGTTADGTTADGTASDGTASDGAAGHDRVLWFLVPGRPAAGLVASEPLRLAVMGATGTVRLRFDGLVVGDDQVVDLAPRASWMVGDRRAAARPNPLCLGIGDRALGLLAELEPAAAAALAPAWAAVGERAEAAAVAAEHRTDDIAALAAARAESIQAVQRLTTALLAAVGGRGAELGHPAQRLAREALFYVVQAQSADGRVATLGALGSPAVPPENPAER